MQSLGSRILPQRGFPTHKASTRSAAVAAPEAPTSTQAQAVALPAHLRNSVAVLQVPNSSVPSGKTDVYLLGVSHVSQKSCDQVRELVRLVSPDVVMVELCKDRLELLVDDKQTKCTAWHSRKIQVEDLPQSEGWPSVDELRAVLTCRPGRPVTAQQIEGDVFTLLGTGLFGSVRPICDNPGPQEVPAFTVSPQQEGGLRSVLVPPLGAIRFKVKPRQLPPIGAMSLRLDSSIQGASEGLEPQLQALCQDVVAACKAEGASAVNEYLKLRAAVQALYGDVQVVVAFKGVDSGNAEMIVKARKASDPSFVSGLEGSALKGEGFAIEPFRPMKQKVQVSNKMFLPQEVVDRLKAQRQITTAQPALTDVSSASSQTSQSSPAATSTSEQAGPSWQPRVRADIRPWSQEEFEGAAQAEPQLPSQPVADFFARTLTGSYARSQAKAGRVVGISAGAAWRAALEAATEVGAGAVILGDIPNTLTQRRLADAMLAQCGGRLAGAVGLVVGSIAACVATSVLPETAEAGVVSAASAAAAALIWPVVAPLSEVSKLAEMSASEIEDAVAIKEPLKGGDLSRPLKLFGEDALLDWPGAMGPVIDERDTYMAKTIAAVASGSAGPAPAYVLEQVDGQPVWRYCMPEGAPSMSAPKGKGDGALRPLQGVKAVVGVVGSAHVRGMVREWDSCVKDTNVSELLKVE